MVLVAHPVTSRARADAQNLRELELQNAAASGILDAEAAAESDLMMDSTPKSPLLGRRKAMSLRNVSSSREVSRVDADALSARVDNIDNGLLALRREWRGQDSGRKGVQIGSSS